MFFKILRFYEYQCFLNIFQKGSQNNVQFVTISMIYDVNISICQKK